MHRGPCHNRSLLPKPPSVSADSRPNHQTCTVVGACLVIGPDPEDNGVVAIRLWRRGRVVIVIRAGVGVLDLELLSQGRWVCRCPFTTRIYYQTNWLARINGLCVNTYPI